MLAVNGFITRLTIFFCKLRHGKSMTFGLCAKKGFNFTGYPEYRLVI